MLNNPVGRRKRLEAAKDLRQPKNTQPDLKYNSLGQTAAFYGLRTTSGPLKTAFYLSVGTRPKRLAL